MKKVSFYISEMLQTKKQNPPAFVVDNIMNAARAKTEKKSFAIKLRNFAFSMSGAFAAGFAAIFLTLGLYNLSLTGPAPAEEFLAMYVGFENEIEDIDAYIDQLIYEGENV